ncbi:2-oxoisovalerate dehydrogenase subunit beta isoform X17 [Drosophila biarmipes]|uniref:2-oxoisovalerate dehydrogenase subunit beta isoform X16 n=1 Tax=Drosophila biarmipes TaxID=125945 RepID=UPI0007E75E12|nr:2-oxoisovalerate dehydrogenase subunit beta isoform X16 [Drosophila biarmipes]XP_050745735.1 2-oxoisovalerate dehydrogenase subunit beta isoform X17 [Drosophila biarmipes]
MIVSQVAGRFFTSMRSIRRSQVLIRSHFTYYPSSLGTGKKMNMFNAINNAMDLALSDDKSTLLFGEDVGFGGVFRCSINLRDKYGSHRVFNSPLCEQGIAGAIGPTVRRGGRASIVVDSALTSEELVLKERNSGSNFIIIEYMRITWPLSSLSEIKFQISITLRLVWQILELPQLPKFNLRTIYFRALTR